MKKNDLLQYGSAFVKAKIFKRGTPLLVGWDITGRCNADCRYCGIADKYSSELDTAAIELIDKLEAAINIFPQCDLTIEGHTDSKGNAGRNVQLSMARAQSVMDYITNKMRIPDYRITAIGYGDARPISNNKAAEGRAKNRRIDLIIAPKPESL